MSDPGASSPRDRWFATFERAITDRFPHHFGQFDWGFQLDRGGPTLTVGDQRGAPSVTTDLPPNYLERDPWLLAAILLARLRRMAEDDGFLEQRP